MKKLALFLLLPALLFCQNPPSSPAILAINTGATVAASTTDYITFAGGSFGTTEAARQFAVPFGCTAQNLYVVTSGTQSSTGPLTVTLRKNAVSTAVAVVVAANAAGGTYSDLSHTAAFAAGDLMSVQVVNLATATSTIVVGISASCK